MEIKKILDHLKNKYNISEFINSDPIQFVHRYKHRKDIEVTAFLVATITWGKRPMILKSAEKMLKMMGNKPYDYIMNECYKDIVTSNNIHRTFFEDDFVYFAKGLNRLFNQYDSIEQVFSVPDSLWDGITAFRKEFVIANNGVDTKHISNPEKNSACKRLHMALRWLVRNDGIVDLGLWKNINPSSLYIPLDTHVASISRELGLLKRKSNDKKAVDELTCALLDVDPKDPIGYDFALFGWGEDRASNG